MSGTDQQRHAMIKDIQIDPISRKMIHIDFVRVVMDEVIRVNIPVHLSGVSRGVREGGVLDWQIRELHVECLPNAIPDKIDVDITNLGAHEQVRVSDLQLPEGVKVAEDVHRVIIGVTSPRAEIVAEVAAVDATSAA